MILNTTRRLITAPAAAMTAAPPGGRQTNSMRTRASLTSGAGALRRRRSPPPPPPPPPPHPPPPPPPYTHTHILMWSCEWTEKNIPCSIRCFLSAYKNKELPLGLGGPQRPRLIQIKFTVTYTALKSKGTLFTECTGNVLKQSAGYVYITFRCVYMVIEILIRVFINSRFVGSH